MPPLHLATFSCDVTPPTVTLAGPDSEDIMLKAMRKLLKAKEAK